MQSSAFGQDVVVNHADQPKGLVILFTDEPPQPRDSLAEALADLDYAVVQVQTGQWLAAASNGERPGCVDIASAALSLADQASTSIDKLAADPPIVVGTGDAASLA